MNKQAPIFFLLLLLGCFAGGPHAQSLATLSRPQPGAFPLICNRQLPAILTDSGDAEVVQIAYDPSLISYEQLMDVFFFLHDPTQMNRQGNDIGTQYRSVIFFKDEAEKAKAENALKQSELSERWNGTYVTEITKLEEFFPAEQYHQGYYEVNPTQPYCSAVVGPKIAKFKKHYGELGMLRADLNN